MFKPRFGILPGHWGLAGKTREIAKAEYELTGYDLDAKLLEIKKDEIVDYDKKLIDLKLKHGKLTEAEYLRSRAEMISDPKQKALALLELDRKEGKLSDREYEKQSATLKGEPWVTVINMDFDKKTSLEGSLELDWNDYFVEKLKSEGYQAPTSELIVNQWFVTVCRNVAMEEFDGTGDFTADSEANLETLKRWNSEQMANNRRAHK